MHVNARARRASAAIARLVRVMAVLRSPSGCPWDREQTHQTLRAHLIEETYEAIDALDRGEIDALAGELGDVLFQCVFHAQIAAEAGRFDLSDSLAAITAKLIRRHPHIFTARGRPLTARARRRAGIGTAAAVKEQWERIKAGEQAAAGTKKRILTGVPRTMPSLLRAHEIGRRVAAVGFEWSTPGEVMDKIDEEARELRDALAEGPGRAVEELGDLLFSVANLSRKLGLEPEAALRAANDKFTRRFEALEAELERQGRSVHGTPLQALETVWQTVKTQEAARVSSRKSSTGVRSSTARRRTRRRSRS
jgi:ATP diphosphatase